MPTPDARPAGETVDLDGAEALAAHGQSIITALCRGDRSWTMSVPARPDDDPDLVLSAALGRIPALVTEVRHLRALLAGAPPTNAPETSTSLVGTAPDAELDRLLIEYARCQVQARYASRSQPELNRRAYAVEYAAAAIHAHVERVKREARGELLALVRATVADDAQATTYQTMGSYRTALLQYLDVQDGRVGNTVRRREKEEG